MASAAASSGKKLKVFAETTTVMATAATSSSVDAPSPTVSPSSSSTSSSSSSSSSSVALRDSLAGAVAGSANLLCGYPFDIVKTTLQAAPPGTYSSPWAAARAIARGETAATLGGAGGGGGRGAGGAGGAAAAEGLPPLHAKNSTGFRAFFRGASAPLVGAALETGVNYACYSASLRALSRVAGAPPASSSSSPSSSREQEQEQEEDPRLTAPLPLVAAAAAVAGGALSFVLSPFELVKVRLQADAAAYRSSSTSSYLKSSSPSPGPASVLRATLAAEGLLGLTRGLVATAAREVPGNAIFFVTYESLRRWFYFFDANAKSPRAGVGGASSSSSSSLDDSGRASSTTTSTSSSSSSSVASAAAASVAAGGLAGGLMWACVLPVDVAKTRVQLLRPGAPRAALLPTLVALAREGGRRSLWAGLAPTLARAVPANAAQWLAFEAALSVWPRGGGGGGE